MKNIFVTLSLFLICVSANASEEKSLEEMYYTVEKIKITEISSNDKDRIEDEIDIDATTIEDKEEVDDGLITMVGDGMLAYGRRIWNIVTAGAPTSTSSHVTPVSVIPDVNGTATAMYQMENWSIPKMRKFKVEYKNLMGISVVSFTYGVTYQAGGSFKGKGKYLTGINIDASNISVLWGFGFNATSSLVAISNMGSKENPVAAATMKINYELTSPFRNIKNSKSFHIVGDNRLIPVVE
ncbi:MAG: hypothetical protein KC493_09350 [Bacteriovoracaceae bacterium]|nr:hypothetical protein [Bacteriovoracaceae bacterium]